MADALGRRRWASAEGYIPAASHGPAPEMTSHETACLLDAGAREAKVTITTSSPIASPRGPIG